MNVQETGGKCGEIDVPELDKSEDDGPPDVLPKHPMMQQLENEADRSEVEMLSQVEIGGKGPQLSRT